MYELSAVLSGHSADVRCCCMDAVGHIITGSRDKTTIVWEQNDHFDESTPAGQRWRVKRKLEGHTGFINAVAVLKATEEFPLGLILTAGQDKLVNVYCIGMDEPLIWTLVGHTAGVTALSTGWNGTILSGSADTTVRVWEGMKEIEVLKGHEAPVWDVAVYPGRGTYLSASGDQTIRLWKDGACVQIYRGHTDAVRSLSVRGDGSFLSCGNDGTVRAWSTEGTPISSVKVGTNFLYSMCSLPNGGVTVVGEGGAITFLSEAGQVVQGLQVPAISVWSCSPLPDGDVLVGSSDGLARIFSPHETKYAPLEDRDRMSQELASQKHSKETIGDLDTSKLQGPEALNKAGTEGQMIMINQNGKVELHKFSGGSWQSIGVVQDAYDKDKHELAGKTYDHVITVDIADGQEPIKLGVNNDDDPWVVAQEFINKNLLPQAYLGEIADYITKNTGVGSKPLELDSNYCDPYTGAGRYVPPAQGSGSANPAIGSPRYFPEKKPVTETIPDASKLTKKITEFNGQVDEKMRLSESELIHFEKIAKMTSEGSPLHPDDFVLVGKLLTWDSDHVFPCIDLLRSINKAFPTFIPIQDKLRIASEKYNESAVSCARVALRLLVDITVQHTQHCTDNFPSIVIPALVCLHNTDKKFVGSSVSKILYNMSCVESDVQRSREILDVVTQVLEWLFREIPTESERKQHQFHLLIATGNIISRHKELAQSVKKPLIQKLTKAEFDKARITANDILVALK